MSGFILFLIFGLCKRLVLGSRGSRNKVGISADAVVVGLFLCLMQVLGLGCEDAASGDVVSLCEMRDARCECDYRDWD